MKALPYIANRTGSTVNITPGLVIEGSLVAVGLFLGLRFLIRKGISNAAQNNSIEEKSPESFAKEFRQGFDNDGWWGTNVPRVRKTMQDMPSRQFFKKVMDAYGRLYMGENMMRRMEDELTSTEYDEILNILRGKPLSTRSSDIRKANAMKIVYWAKRLNEAVNYTIAFLPGRDSDGIEAVLREIPNQRTYKLVESYYPRISSGKSLRDDLRGYRFWKYSEYMKIIQSKPL